MYPFRDLYVYIYQKLCSWIIFNFHYREGLQLLDVRSSYTSAYYRALCGDDYGSDISF